MPDSRPGTDFLRRDLLSRAQRLIGLLVLVPLAERLGSVDEECRLALGHGELVEVHAILPNHYVFVECY